MTETFLQSRLERDELKQPLNHNQSRKRSQPVDAYSMRRTERGESVSLALLVWKLRMFAKALRAFLGEWAVGGGCQRLTIWYREQEVQHRLSGR